MSRTVMQLDLSTWLLPILAAPVELTADPLLSRNFPQLVFYTLLRVLTNIFLLLLHSVIPQNSWNEI